MRRRRTSSTFGSTQPSKQVAHTVRRDRAPISRRPVRGFDAGLASAQRCSAPTEGTSVRLSSTLPPGRSTGCSAPKTTTPVRGDGGWGRRFLAERRGLAQCDATIAAACRVQSEGSKWRTARCPPTGGGLCPPMGGQGRTASARTTSANIPPRPSTHPNLGALRGGGVTSGLFRWGDRRTSSARGMIGRTTSASLVSLRGRRAQHEYEPVHTPAS